MPEINNLTGFTGKYTTYYNGAVKAVAPFHYGAPSYTLGSKQVLEPVATGTFIPGVIRVNPVYISRVQASCTEGYVETIIKNGWKYVLEGQIALTPRMNYLNDDSYVTALGNEAHIKASAKIKDADFDTALFLVELQETLNMLRHPLKGISDAIASYKKARDTLRTLKASADSFSNLWLQFIYGVKPFMMDVEGVLGLYAKGIKKQLSYVRKRARVEYHASTSVNGANGVTLYNFIPKFNHCFTLESFYVANVYYQHLLQSDISWTASRLGFSIANIPALAWERVPYSFVVDWFLRVGEWLKAITPDPSYEYLASCVSQKIVLTQRSTVTGITNTTSSINSAGLILPEYVHVRETLRRVKNPKAVYFPPLNTAALSLTKQITSCALSWQQVNNLLRKLK